MAWHTLFLLLASGQVEDVAPPAPPRLFCRYETPISRLMLRRRLCLTQAEWEKRDHEIGEASRKSIYEVMGNTSCVNGGFCTS